MKKVCFVIPNLKIGGGNRVFIELANKLVEKGCSAEIIHPVNTKDKITFDISSKVLVKSIGWYQKSKLGKVCNIILLLVYVFRKRNEFKIICSDPFICILFLCLPKTNLYRFIQADDYAIFDDKLIIQNDFSLGLYKRLILMSYRQNLNYIFNSSYVYEKFLILSKRRDVPFKLVHPAINHEKFNVSEIKKWDSKLNICTVARKHPLKGFSDFIEAWQKVKDRISDKIDKVYIISHDDLGEFEIDDFHRITPESDEDICYYLNKSHIFISTSWWEGFGLPPLEAMACGCACIISNSGGVLEYARNRENSLMYTSKNVSELELRILEAISNIDLLKRMSNNSLITAERFSWEKSSNELLKCLS